MGRLLTVVRAAPRHPGRTALVLLALAAAVLAAVPLVRTGRVRLHLKEARAAFERRDTEAADRHLAECLRLAPGRGEVRLLAARNARRGGRLDEAADHLAAAEADEAEADDVAVERALLRLLRGSSSEEEALAERAARGDDTGLLALEVLVQRCIDTYRLMKAQEGLSVYLQHRPDDLAALLSRAWVWEKLFYHADAVIDLRRAFALAPENENVRRRLGEALLVHGTPEEAAVHFEWLRQRRPGDPEVRVNLARARRRAGRLEEALALLDGVLADRPDHAAARAERGQVMLDDGRLEEAARDLRSALERDPFDRVSLFNLVNCLVLQGRETEAAALRERGRRLDDDLHRLDAATRRVHQDPADLEARFEAGSLFLRNGQVGEGVRWLQHLLVLDPRHRPTHQLLAEWFAAHGEPERAAWHRAALAP